MASEMVERGVEALRPIFGEYASPAKLEAAARAVLGAAREPSEAIVRAMNLALAREHTTNVNVSATMQAWSDGIDAALSEGA